MTNAQMAQYLGKIHIMPLMKVESGPLYQRPTQRKTLDEHKFVVRGDTHEEKLQHLVETVPAHRLLLAIAIGDIHLNSLTTQASQKYEFSKSRIQRAISGKTEHKKGGKQYQQERKRKAEPEASTSTKKSKDDDEDNEEEEA